MRRHPSPGGRPPLHRAAREIALWLGVKVLALAALFFLFFGPEHRPQLTPETVADHLAAPAQATGPAEETASDD